MYESPLKKVEFTPDGTHVEVTDNLKALEGHFSILPLNTLNILVQRGTQRTIRSRMVKMLSPNSKVDINRSGSIRLTSSQAEIGSIEELEHYENPDDIMKQVYKSDFGKVNAWTFDVLKLLPHRDPFLLVQKFLLNENNDILARGTYKDDSVYNAPENVHGSTWYNIGQLAEFGAQSEALRININQTEKQIAVLDSIQIDILSEYLMQLKDGDILESRSLNTPHALDEKGHRMINQCVILLKEYIALTPLIKLSITGMLINKKTAEKKLHLSFPKDF